MFNARLQLSFKFMMTTPPEHLQQQWWYTTHPSKVEGPVSTNTFVSLFMKGYVDGLTIITDDPTIPQSHWLSLSEHPQLSEAARNASTQLEEEDAELHNTPPNLPNAQHEIEAPHIVPGTDQNDDSSQQLSTSVPKPPRPRSAEERERKRLSRKRARKAAKLRNRQNTSVYVTGLPSDTTETEVANVFAKCGIILPNPETGRPRVKLYRNHDGTLKGDALVTYALRPSVKNAISILDGTSLRNDKHHLSVKEATFDHKTPKDENDVDEESRKKPRVPIRGRDLVEEALTWSEDYQNQKGAPRIVILKNVFDPQSVDYDIIREDMKEGCEACGEVEKLTVFERNEEGAVAVKFTTVEASLKCIDVMNGRWYDGRRLHAAFYDGQTDYTHKETDAERKDRERKWEEWLNSKQSASAE